MDRIRFAATTHPTLHPFVQMLALNFQTWVTLVSRSDFTDALVSRDEQDSNYFIQQVRNDIDLLLTVVGKAVQLSSNEVQPAIKKHIPSLGVLAALERYVSTLCFAYPSSDNDGPGDLAEDGPRHDNGKHCVPPIS